MPHRHETKSSQIYIISKIDTDIYPEIHTYLHLPTIGLH